jgi:peptidyl-prolyl cis-trans isomerase A (cyclophilin A)
MDVVESLHGGYGEGAPRGVGPDQSALQQRGNEYLRESFPDLDYVEEATVVE